MPRSLQTIQNATAQADTGQTDALQTPDWARSAIVHLRVSAVAGTTPLTDMKFQYVHPVSGTALDFQWDGITQIAGTTAGHVVVHVGTPNIDTADDTGAVYFVTDQLPKQWNIVTTFDRTTGNETYTYQLAVEWIG